MPKLVCAVIFVTVIILGILIGWLFGFYAGLATVLILGILDFFILKIMSKEQKSKM